eukprot:13367048-Alexandrium_andersonii.AAC.1
MHTTCRSLWAVCIRMTGEHRQPFELGGVSAMPWVERQGMRNEACAKPRLCARLPELPCGTQAAREIGHERQTRSPRRGLPIK